jgi:Flp pilus assembly protein TadG
MRKQRGATLVEAAFTTLILFMFVMGILEFGRIYNLYQIATNAAREGARYAVAPFQGTSGLPVSSAVQAVANGFLNSGNACPAHNCVAVYPATEVVDGQIFKLTKVTVTVPYTFITPKLFGFTNTTVNLTTSAMMRNENN